MLIYIFFVTLALAIILKNKIKSRRLKDNKQRTFNSLAKHYGYCFVLWSFFALIAINLTPLSGIVKYLAIIIFFAFNFWILNYLHNKNFNAKKHIENSGELVLSITAGIGILITIIITASILFEALRFFQKIPVANFLFGLEWNPQISIYKEQTTGKGAFGFIPVLLGTLLITVIAMSIAIPLGIMGAIYLCLYAKNNVRDAVKPILEILAGVPTVVYGYFAVTTIGPFFKNSFSLIGVNIAGESALTAGFVMGIMIIPFILSLTDDALKAVPQSLQDGALAMGSTKSEMIKKVALPAATPSIVGAVILAISRAIGETMIVVMAAGLIANLTINPLNSVTTATAQIVTLLVGDQEFDSPKTLAAFALALTLFVITFIFNIVALSVIKNYKKKYG